MIPDLGVIEGYFGKPWSWSERTSVMETLAPFGFGFFIYAPKADPYLRRQWMEPYPAQPLAEMAEFARRCRDAGVQFGVGISPFEAYLDFNRDARRALADKLAALADLGMAKAAILFDDMSGKLPDLAERQAEIVDFAANQVSDVQLYVCPTYYSEDSVLDRVFGARPESYLETLGALLDPAIHIFWTGQETCALEQAPADLINVAAKIRRKPVLWDNYPVNDGPRMSQHLHLRGFTGRTPVITEYIAGHAINPALQPILGCIPAVTLSLMYASAGSYQYRRAFVKAAEMIVGPQLMNMLEEDLLALQDMGLDRLGARRSTLRERYGNIDHPAAREVVLWLDGHYGVTGEMVKTQ